MPDAPLKFCATDGCGERVKAGHCAAHARHVEQNRGNVDVRRLYRTARWRRLRAQKMAEDNLCAECRLVGRVEPWTDLDHVVPHRGDLNRFWDPLNVRGLCHRHHSMKTATGR